MNINVYLENNLAKQIDGYAKTTGKSRNAIVREALKEWVSHHGSTGWSDTIVNFKGCSTIPRFESTRNELTPPKEDPFTS